MRLKKRQSILKSDCIFFLDTEANINLEKSYPIDL